MRTINGVILYLDIPLCIKVHTDPQGHQENLSRLSFCKTILDVYIHIK